MPPMPAPIMTMCAMRCAPVVKSLELEAVAWAPARLLSQKMRAGSAIRPARDYQRQPNWAPSACCDILMVSVPPAPGPAIALNKDVPDTEFEGAYIYEKLTSVFGDSA